MNTRSKNNIEPYAIFKQIVIDRSGSMSSMGDKPVEMTHRLLMETQEQAKNTGVYTRINVTTFDEDVTHFMQNVDPTVSNMPTFSELSQAMYPRGSTRFNDTLIEEIGKLKKSKETYLKSLNKEIKNLDPKITLILIVITDGQDNYSKSDINTCKQVVKDFRKNNGKAILMAANMNAEIVGSNYGFNRDRCITVHNSDEQAIESGFDAVLDSQRQISQGFDNPVFTQFQRSSSCPISNQSFQLSPPPALQRSGNNLPLSQFY